MPGLRFARRIEQKYGSRIADLFNTGTRPITFSVGDTGAGAAAETNADAGTVTFDRNFLHTASRSDIRGAIIHEMTHAYGVGYGKSSKRVETLADYARYKLNPNEVSSWAPSDSVLAMDQRRGDPMTNPNGGPPVGNSRRNRNTLANNASKATYPGGYQAPLSSASAVSTGDQLAQNRMNYLQQLAMLKAQRPMIGQQFGLAVTDARLNAVSNMTATEGAALDRGVLGGSNDLANRAGVLSQRARDIADAQAARSSARLGLAQEALGIRNNYYTTNANIANSIAQQEAANTTAAYAAGAVATPWQPSWQPQSRRERRRARARTGTTGSTGSSQQQSYAPF